MLKKTVTYKNEENKDVTVELLFNLTQRDVIKLETGKEESYEARRAAIAKKVAKFKNGTMPNSLIKELLEIVEELIAAGFGRKINTPEGVSFQKLTSDEEKETFLNSLAYDALFSEFVANPHYMNDFIKAILPAGSMKPEVAK